MKIITKQGIITLEEDTLENISMKKERVKLTPEQLFNIHQEYSIAGAPVKAILQRHGLNPWDLVALRKKVREASLEILSSSGKRGRKRSVVPLEEFQKLSKELEDTKDALSAVGHEFSLLKKRVNSG